MGADRFSFLEFEGEEDGPASEWTAHEAAPPPAAREIAVERLADGTRLAEVRLADLRGYRSVQTNLEDEDDGDTLSARAGPKPEKPTKLRVTEVLGERGDGAGEFHYPTGLAVDREGVLFVADSQSHRLQRITPSGGVAVIGGRGVGRGQFGSPQGVATDDDDAFYVVEQANCRVQKFTREGVLSLVFGKPGRGEGELHGPTAIAVVPGTGDILVADTGNSRIQRFDAEGRFRSTLGAAGTLGTSLGSPQALAVSPGGSLHAADTFAGRIVRFDPLGRPDRQLGGGSSANEGNGMRARSQFERLPLSLHQPRALALDRTGLLYVADAGEPDPITGQTRGRVRCLSQEDGSLLATVEKVGRSLGFLLRPGGVAVSRAETGGLGRGDLYVSDTMNHRVLRFVWS